MAKPLVLGLCICEEAGINSDTGNFHIVEGFVDAVSLDEFPGTRPFQFFCSLRGCYGLSDILFVVLDPDLDPIHEFEGRLHSADPLRVVNLSQRIEDCVFPRPGVYTFALRIDGEWLAQKSLLFRLPGDEP